MPTTPPPPDVIVGLLADRMRAVAAMALVVAIDGDISDPRAIPLAAFEDEIRLLLSDALPEALRHRLEAVAVVTAAQQVLDFAEALKLSDADIERGVRQVVRNGLKVGEDAAAAIAKMQRAAGSGS